MPERLHETPGYHDVTWSGPVNIAAQVDRVTANALAALAAVGARPVDVARSVIDVVSGETAVLGQVWRQLTESNLGPALTSASTLLGVAQLGFGGQLVELDLTAAPAD